LIVYHPTQSLEVWLKKFVLFLPAWHFHRCNATHSFDRWSYKAWAEALS
jgi:hypothetical protein